MKRSSGNRRRKSNHRRSNGVSRKLESLEARMVMDAAGYEAALDSFMGADRVGKDGPLAMLGWDLTLIYHGGDLNNGPTIEDPDAVEGGAAINALTSSVRDQYLIDSNNRILLDLTVANSASKTQFLTGLSQIAFQQTGELGNAISGWLPIASLGQLAGLSGLATVSAAAVTTNVGSVESQGDASMLTDEVRAEYGLDGSGQKIGVLSDSYDGLGGAAADVASGDLPGAGNPDGNTAPIEVLQDWIDINSSDEGRAMLQLVHDVAPGADLAFTTAFTGKAGFAQGIYNLAAAGSTVIVDDVSYADEPWFSDGMIAKAADQVVQDNVAYFTSAGNSARKSYEGDYRWSGNTYAAAAFDSAEGAPFFFGGESLDFDPGSGVDDRQSITIPAGGGVQLAFQWDDTFLSEHGIASAADIDIYVIVGDTIVAGGVDFNTDAFEFFSVGNSSDTDVNAEIMILKHSGVAPTRVKYNMFRGEMIVNEYATNSGTAVGHSNAEYAMSVGAAYYVDTPAFGAAEPVQESFSSAGGTPILIDQAGNRIAPIYRQNVDIVAPDGTDTTFFPGGDLTNTDSDGTGFPNFFGTSAAAPHAAALASLMRQANPSISALEIHQLMRETAIDMDDTATVGFDVGYDFGTGYGFVDGEAAVLAAYFAGGTQTGGDASCGVYSGPAAIEVQAGLGANLFVTGHAMLDNGVENGQLGYDYEILDFLRGQGTFQEIAAADYSIAVIGNDDADWGFSSGAQVAVGYEATTFYDVDDITPLMWSQILAHDALIILSDENSIAAGGLTEEQIQTIVGAKDAIADAVNGHGLDVWANAGSQDVGYYDFLPTDALEAVALEDDPALFIPTTEGLGLGVNTDMTNADPALVEFENYASSFFGIERRANDEIVSIGAMNVAFVEDAIVKANEATTIMMHGVTGRKFNDANMDGVRQADEAGLAGFTFFIDEDGDGRIGLCEPSAISDANGEFTLYPRYSGTFNILQVIEPGYYSTDATQHVIYVDGDRVRLNASLDSGAVVAVDYGDPGNPYAAHPVVDGMQLGDSPMIDDGVLFSSGLKIGTNTVAIKSSSVFSPGVLQAWMDFNKDGDFNDLGEQIFKNVTLQPGLHYYSFVIPNTVIDDSGLAEEFRIPLNVRFRTDYTLNLGPTGNAFAGEVEDYQVYLAQDAESGIWLSDDEFAYLEDTADQTFDVLAND
ncbi:MAG: S8 family peptidase, partial [Blastopirellula sp. JB062]